VAKTTKIDAVTFAGRSGKGYEFRVYVWETKFKSLPGVYVIASRSIEPGQPARYEPVFVGAADDLSKVFKNHPRNDCFQLYYANVVGVLKETDSASREAITPDLAAGLSPPCNGADADLG
jgi:hypothetical protein